MSGKYISNFYTGDSSSDDDEEGRDMTPSERREYDQMLDEGEGFDFDFAKFYGLFGVGLFPVSNITGEYEKTLTELSCYAIKQHNEEKGVELELVRIIKANMRFGSGIMYYITLEAKERTEDIPKVYQSRVWDGVGNKIDVEVFRLKPSSPTASSSSSSSLLSAL